ncbi:UNVERIFIED_CONTAM: hypothetical protein FKN15_068749 [Acipenser sinensis]
MGRRSCKKQQKRQQRQLPPGEVGPRYVVDEWCPGCGEFGHTVAICPTQYQEEEVEPQPQEEDGWEALLRSMGVPYCCFICREVVKRIWERFGKVQVDLFASADTTRCPLWYSLHCLGGPLGIDALAHELPSTLLYTLPPIPLLPALLKKVRLEKVASSPNDPPVAQENLVFDPAPGPKRPALDLLSQAKGTL